MKYIKSVKNPRNFIEVSSLITKAKFIHLDKRSKFFKSRMKSLTEVGYTKHKETITTLTLALS